MLENRKNLILESSESNLVMSMGNSQQVMTPRNTHAHETKQPIMKNQLW